jgi:hypothetical protein
MPRLSDNPTLTEIVKAIQELQDEAAWDTPIFPEPTPPPVVVQPPAPAPTPPPPPVTGYSRTIVPNLTNRGLLINTNDTLVNLAGQVLPELDIVLSVGVRNVCIRAGTIRSISSQIPGNRQPCYDGLIVENVVLRNTTNSTMELHGNNTRLTNVTATAERYSLWLGESEDLLGLRITDCNFTSAGPESTVRVTDCNNVVIRNTTLQNGAKHCLRFHGRTAGVTLDGVSMMGGGNGLAIGALQGVGASVSDVRIERSRINVRGPDRLNLARDGSLRGLNIVSLSLVSPPGWDLVQEYRGSHPADWNVDGLVSG